MVFGGFVVVGVLAVVWGAHYVWLQRVKEDLKSEAKIEYSRFLRQEETLIASISEARFTELYQTTHTPRLPKYSLMTVCVFLIGTPVMFALLSAGMWYLERTAPAPAQITETLLLNERGSAKLLANVPPEALHYILLDWSGFYYFFGMLFFWVGVCTLLMYYYHKRRPEALRPRLLRAKAAAHSVSGAATNTRSQ